jgi:hypothetical protein
VTRRKRAEVNRTPTNLTVNAVELKTIELRLNAVRDATQRSRFVFIVMTIMTATILISLWNAMLSWDGDMALELRPQLSPIASPAPSPAASPTPMTDQDRRASLVKANQDTVTSEWLKNLVVSVGLLGIRISTNDLAVVGSASSIVIMVWFFFSQRRENRAIVGLLRDCSKRVMRGQLSKDVGEMVYEGVVQNIVFIDMGGGDAPLRGLSADTTQSERNRFVRTILTGLVFLPPITIILIVVSDLSSVFLTRSYLRISMEHLWKVLLAEHHYGSLAKIAGFDAIAVASAIYTLMLCLNCREFTKATSATIKDFSSLVHGRVEVPKAAGVKARRYPETTGTKNTPPINTAASD